MATCMFYYCTFATFAGYGLRCHRVLIAMCKMIGFQDMHCKVEGSTKNTKAVAKAFMEAVTSQVRSVKICHTTVLYPSDTGRPISSLVVLPSIWLWSIQLSLLCWYRNRFHHHGTGTWVASFHFGNKLQFVIMNPLANHIRAAI